MRATITIPRDVHLCERTRRYIEEEFCYRFGGATTYQGKGSWVDDAGQIVYNDVHVIETYYDMHEADAGWHLYEISKEAQTILNQDTVMYTVNENNYYS